MRSGYYNQDNPFKEGTFHSFRYIKHVKLEDGQQYMILEDVNGFKYFVEYEPYKNYELKEASEIVCLIDKINCTGRIFLEPEHPVYKIGENYEFKVSSIIESEEGGLIIVHDCFNNPININNFNHLPQIGDERLTISARVEKIRKGIPELSLQ